MTEKSPSTGETTEKKRNATPEASGHGQLLAQQLNTIHQIVNAVAAKHRVRPSDIAREILRRTEGANKP